MSEATSTNPIFLQGGVHADPNLDYDQRIQATNRYGERRETTYKLVDGKRVLVSSAYLPPLPQQTVTSPGNVVATATTKKPLLRLFGINITTGMLVTGALLYGAYKFSR